MSVKHALQSFARLLKDKYVKWFTDNQGVATIVNSGSSKAHLHKLALDIFSLSEAYTIVIEIQWIPRTENEVANYLSKTVDFDEWTVKDSYF